MAQITFADGDVLTASQLNTYCTGEGGAWTSHTPTITQGASVNIAKTVNFSKYGRWGRMIIWNFDVEMTAAGTAGTGVTLTLPVTAASVFGVPGAGFVYDLSTTIGYSCFISGVSTTTVSFRYESTGGWGLSPNLALASGDILRGSITYEAAA